MKQGLLLINLGTPEAPDNVSVRRYLRTFLSDKHVIDLPILLRYFLLFGIILPFRTKQSAKAYQAIWTEHGSPLLYHSEALLHELKQHLASDFDVALAMRYSKPSIEDALSTLSKCSTIIVLPLYPQYAMATTGSSIAVVQKLVNSMQPAPTLRVIQDFYNHPAFISAQAEQIKPYLNTHEYILFSYHGLPERQLNKVGCKTICKTTCPKAGNRYCYRAQCLQTTSEISTLLKLDKKNHSSSFQSRLGRTPWIKPYTDEILPELAQQGIKRLAITCPSFVADCVETLEEIAMRAKKQWLALGGEKLTLIPALNSNSNWVAAIGRIAKDHSATDDNNPVIA